MVDSTHPAFGTLSDDDMERLRQLLRTLAGGVDLETMDGVLTALCVAPELMLPDEWLAGVLSDGGGEAGKRNRAERRELVELVFRRWHDIGDALASPEGLIVPLVEDGADGLSGGNAWARGFLRGAQLSPEAFHVLFSDRKNVLQFGFLLPFLHENDPDPKLRFPAIPPERRLDYIAQMAAAVTRLYRYFRTPGYRKAAAKIAAKDGVPRLRRATGQLTRGCRSRK